MANGNERLRRYEKAIEDSLNEVRETQDSVVPSLRDLADELDVKQRDMNIAKTSFASSGIVGAGLTVAGIIAAPFTAGLSLGLTVAGVGVGVASGVGSLATTIAQEIINSQTRKQADANIKKYNKSVDRLEKIIDEFIEEVRENKEYYQSVLIKRQSASHKRNQGDTVKLISRLMKETTSEDKTMQSLRVGWQFSACAGAALGRSAMAATGAAMRAFRIGGAVLSVVTVPVDLVTIVKNSIKIDKKTPSQVAELIREIAEKLEQHKALQCLSEKLQ